MLESAQVKFCNNKTAKCGNDSKAVSRVMKEILQRKKEIKLPIYWSAKGLATSFVQFVEDKVSNIRAGFYYMNNPYEFHIPFPERYSLDPLPTGYVQTGH